jgi:hypothetical protein
LNRGSNGTVDVDEDTKREANGKRMVIDKETGKSKEVDIYDRAEAGSKKKDTEKLKAIFSSNLEQSIMPSNISKFLKGVFTN